LFLANGGLKAIYCNDKYLVVHSNGKANHQDGLASIPHPPGGGDGSYSTSCVTRSYHLSYAIYKIPLNPVLLPTASASNNLDIFVGKTDPPGLSSNGLPMRGCCYCLRGQLI
jgi:hypothetical protein